MCICERERDCVQHERVLVTRLHVCMAHASMMGEGGGVQTHLRVRNDPVGGRVWIHESSQLQCKVKCSD